jgi:Tfp pilus assembly protein PilN
LIEVNLQPGGKRRGARGPRFSISVPSFGGLGRDRWVLGSSLVVIATVALCGWLYTTTGSRASELQVQIDQALADSARYADLIQQNESLLARQDSIAQRVQIIQEIDEDRYVWAHIMDEVARALPEYTWLTELLQVSLGDEVQFRLTGRAGNTFALTQFMENLEGSQFLRDVRLNSTDQIVEELGEGGLRRAVYEFVLEILFDRPPVEFLETVPLLDVPSSGQ